MPQRPSFIRHHGAIETGAGQGEFYCVLAPFGRALDAPVKLLIAGERSAGDRLRYPLNPERQGEKPWPDVPRRTIRSHDARPRPPRRSPGEAP
jgi:hypothetical protein